MIDKSIEKRCLQICVATACIVPILGGLLGMVEGGAMTGHAGDVTLDSHVRYLSGLLFGIGLTFAASISNIEMHSARIALLSSIIIVGGLARLYGVAVDGLPDVLMRFALIMELAVVPLLWLWQRRVAKLFQ